MSHPIEYDPARWFAVRTKPKQEARAEANLRGWGLETLAPWLRERRPSRNAAGSPWGVAPLFPGYLFARFDPSSVVKVRLTRGVRDVIGFGEAATPVDDSVIVLIRSRIESDGFVKPQEPKAGEFVRVVDGPLRTLVGVFDRELQGRDRVLILLATLGSQVRLEVDRGSIVRAIGSAV